MLNKILIIKIAYKRRIKMDLIQEFNRVMNETNRISLATTVDNIPNVRVVNFYNNPQNKKIVYFASFRGSSKTLDLLQNNIVAFTTIPVSNESSEHVRVKNAIVKKSDLTIYDLKNGLKYASQPIGHGLIRSKDAEVAALLIQTEDITDKSAEFDHILCLDLTGSGHIHGILAEIRQTKIPQQQSAISMGIGADPAVALGRQLPQFGNQTALRIEEFFRFVACEPFFQQLQMFGLFHGDGHLMRAEGSFDLLTVHNLGTGSVSAFCNAGFDLMGHTSQYISLCNYEGDWVVIGTISFLIITGGIGFIVWDDLSRKKLDFRHYMLHTKIVLVTTAVLLITSTILFYLMERNNILVGLNGSETFLACFFSAVTPRTAGFNNVDTAALTDGSKFLSAILMFIGGSPGSTAGGIKTSTLAVLLLYVHSNIRQTYGVEIFGRRLEDESIRQSACILTINLGLMLAATIAIMVSQNLPMSDVFFETCSAIGTSGMSTGVTRSLNSFSRIVIILLMYCGRIGSLSFALAFTRSNRKPHVQLPAERITIG